MRFTRFFRALALAAESSGDGRCDEEGENAGLLEGLARLDAAGGTVIVADATPTGTTGGEGAFEIGRVELICSGVCEVRLSFS